MPTEKFPSMAHQLEARRQARGRAAFAYFMEMGTGKSKTVIDEMAELRSEGRIDFAVVLAGKGSYRDWTDEHLRLHMPDEIDWFAHLWTGGTSRREEREREEFVEEIVLGKYLCILVMNIEALGSSRRAQSYLVRCIEEQQAMVIVDESASIRNWQSKRTKFLVAYVKPHAVVRRGLTGTPVLRSPMDLWGLYMFLGPHLLRQSSYYGFRGRYAITKEMDMGTHKVVREVGVKNLPELAELLKESSFRVLKEDCVDLPEKIYQRRIVEMTDEQYTYYNSLTTSGIVLHEDKLGTVRNVLTQIIRMHQVLCGYWVDDERVAHRVASNRESDIMEAIEETGESVIVWFAYRRCLSDLATALRTAYGEASVVEYHGGTSPEARAQGLHAFQSGQSRFFLSTLATGCRGLNLVRGSVSMYHSNTSDLEHRLQSEDRNHRIGQTRGVNYLDFYCRGTIEEKIVRSLRDKIDIAVAVQSDGPKAWLLPARRDYSGK